MKNERKALTLIEILTVVTIIAILLGVLVPSVSMVRKMAKDTQQRSQFAAIELALEAFKNDYGDYPPSSWSTINTNRDYCGAQKLAEALLGFDLLGFHPDSKWRSDGRYGDISGSGTGNFGTGNLIYDANDPNNLRARRGPYIDVTNANVFRLGISVNKPGLFANTRVLAPDTFVICDVFGVKNVPLPSGKLLKAGTPILYYKANTSSKTIRLADPIADRIYNAYDNNPLVELGSLVKGTTHPIILNGGDFVEFYGDDDNIPWGMIRDSKVTATKWPVRPDSYILISAGADGLYGTSDDIKNY